MKGHNPAAGTFISSGEDDSSAESDFLNLFCGKFGCATSKFEKLVFLECVYPEGRDVARLLRLVYPGFFRSDFALIEKVSRATSLSDFKKLVDFHAAQTSQEGGLRVLLKVRISKQKLLKLAETIFDGSVPTDQRG
jgi:hypothetical protein